MSLSVLEDSRKVLTLRAFFRVTPADVRSVMLDLIETHGKPKHFITDHGGEFCDLNLGIDHRFGRVGCPASTARVERFFKSLKRELLRYVFCPTAKSCQRHLDEYGEFFNRWRLHQALGGRTPEEVYAGEEAAALTNFVPPSQENAERLTFCDSVITIFRRKAA